MTTETERLWVIANRQITDEVPRISTLQFMGPTGSAANIFAARQQSSHGQNS